MILKYLHHTPIIAILRGLRPSRAKEVGLILYSCGIRVIEVPLNSHLAIESIAILRETLPVDCLIGAGTVITVKDCLSVVEAGGRLIISPHTDPDLIRYTKKLGCISIPGVLSPTEALTALDAGADGLKLFPASLGGIPYFKAIAAILPPQTIVCAVGGVGPHNCRQWIDAGVQGLGIGSACFKPEWSLDEIKSNTSKLLEALAR
jgi:2-dehydro-3-deoxyphosphogalactonate aldolase